MKSGAGLDLFLFLMTLFDEEGASLCPHNEGDN